MRNGDVTASAPEGQRSYETRGVHFLRSHSVVAAMPRHHSSKACPIQTPTTPNPAGTVSRYPQPTYTSQMEEMQMTMGQNTYPAL